MSQSPPNAETLKLFVQCLHTVPDPRSKHGTHQPFGTILAIIFLGLIGNRNNPTAIARWTEQHYKFHENESSPNRRNRRFTLFYPDLTYRHERS